MTSVAARVFAAMRGSLTVELWSHKPYGAGSIPVPATRTVRRKKCCSGVQRVEMPNCPRKVWSWAPGRLLADYIRKGGGSIPQLSTGPINGPKRSKHSPSVGGT